MRRGRLHRPGRAQRDSRCRKPPTIGRTPCRTELLDILCDGKVHGEAEFGAFGGAGRCKRPLHIRVTVRGRPSRRVLRDVAPVSLEFRRITDDPVVEPTLPHAPPRRAPQHSDAPGRPTLNRPDDPAERLLPRRGRTQGHDHVHMIRHDHAREYPHPWVRLAYPPQLSTTARPPAVSRTRPATTRPNLRVIPGRGPSPSAWKEVAAYTIESGEVARGVCPSRPPSRVAIETAMEVGVRTLNSLDREVDIGPIARDHT